VSCEHFNQGDCEGNGGATERSALLWQHISKKIKENKMEVKDKRFMEWIISDCNVNEFSGIYPYSAMFHFIVKQGSSDC
jgi:hypothetical protein